MDLTAISSSNAASGAAKTARTGLGEDLNTFLTMLTTQLKNQDPTNPMDTHQMTAQLVDFANVEQQIAQNQNLEDSRAFWPFFPPRAPITPLAEDHGVRRARVRFVFHITLVHTD